MSDPKFILSQFIEAGRIPHTLLFSGPDVRYKTSAALEFVKSLIPINAIPFDFVHVLDSPVPIERVRELKQSFFEGPLIGPYKIALIASAGDLRLDAANTFLKLLEEPPSRALFILLAQSRASLLATIASRALEIRFPAAGPVPCADLTIFAKSSLGEKFKWAQNYNLKNKTALLNIIDAWLMSLRHKLVSGNGADINFLKKIFQLRKIISSTNANPQLLLEELFINTI